MAYLPGSFTRNFGWRGHGRGLKKLHEAIREGFSGRATPVDREQWRTASGVSDRDINLLPVNFYLNNSGSEVVPDELVLRAIGEEHSRDWDRLVLFALNLSNVGAPPDGADPLPTRWANEFVRERLYRDGAWQRSALLVPAMDEFLAPRIAASKDGWQKCRRNYRHIWELCGYLPSPLPQINSGASRWMSSALFLAWDRTFPTSRTIRAELIEFVGEAELHKLLGVPPEIVDAVSPEFADLYQRLGGTSRLEAAATRTTNEVSEFTGAETGADEIVERAQRLREEQQRDRIIVSRVKRMYEDTCCYCGLQLHVGSGRFYSEAAHVKPLGRPSNGPDKISNLIVLCPNHHKQFDNGVIQLVRADLGWQWLDAITGLQHPLILRHELDDACADWRSRWSSTLVDA